MADGSDPFAKLPMELREKIFTQLPLEQRYRTRRVSKTFRSSTLHGITRLIFTSRSNAHKYRLVVTAVGFPEHTKCVVDSWHQIGSMLKQCREVQTLKAVRFVLIGFTDPGPVNTLGQYLLGVEQLEFYECQFMTVDNYQSLTNFVDTVAEFRFKVGVPLPHIRTYIQLFLHNNQNLRHLTLRHTSGKYTHLQIGKALEYFHISADEKKVAENLFASLEQASGQSLRVYRNEHFTQMQENHLGFPNLEDIRLADINHHLSPDVIPSSERFPNLRILTIRFGSRYKPPDEDDLTWLFKQHRNLAILDLGYRFRDEDSIKVIADSCPNLVSLTLGVKFKFSRVGVKHLKRLANLVQLIISGPGSRITPDQMTEVLEGLPRLRVLVCYCIAHGSLASGTAFFNKAKTNPKELHWLDFGMFYNEGMPGQNVCHPRQWATGIIYAFGDMKPFGRIDYLDWQQLTRQSLGRILPSYGQLQFD